MKEIELIEAKLDIPAIFLAYIGFGIGYAVTLHER
jgi:hypothetical protein